MSDDIKLKEQPKDCFEPGHISSYVSSPEHRTGERHDNPEWILDGQYWAVCHTMCMNEVQTIKEHLEPWIQVAKDYLAERSNGVLRGIAIGAINPSDPREILDATVKDFVGYMAHRLTVYLPQNAWGKR